MSSTETGRTPRTLCVLPGQFAVCRLRPDELAPAWAYRPAAFASITRTHDELSVICPEEFVPPSVTSDGGWRCLRLDGPFDLDEPGVLAAVVEPLADAGVSAFAVASYDTDHVLVDDLERALEALGHAGHRIRPEAGAGAAT